MDPPCLYLRCHDLATQQQYAYVGDCYHDAYEEIDDAPSQEDADVKQVIPQDSNATQDSE